MNKKEQKTTTNNIIFNDKDLEVLVRNLVKKANEKGVPMSHLVQAVTTIWKEEFPVEKAQTKLTKKEEIFSNKVKNFLKHYENDLADFYSEHFKDTLFHGIKWNSYIGESYYKILCSMYVTLEREKKITKRLIVEFARKHFKLKSTNIGEEIDLLYNFTYFHLYFDNNRLPEYSKNLVSHNFSIQYQKEFIDFKSQYGFSRIRAIDTSLALVWIIQKYF